MKTKRQKIVHSECIPFIYHSIWSTIFFRIVSSCSPFFSATAFFFIFFRKKILLPWKCTLWKKFFSGIHSFLSLRMESPDTRSQLALSGDACVFYGNYCCDSILNRKCQISRCCCQICYFWELFSYNIESFDLICKFHIFSLFSFNVSVNSSSIYISG